MADTEVQGGFNHVVEKDMSQARLQAAQQYNAQVMQQRQNAPSSLKSGTPEEARVKEEERQDAQQSFSGGGFNREGSSKDSFASQREAALSSGKFDYSAVRSASYSPPSNFVNNKGARVARPSEPVQSVPVPEKIVTKTEPPSINQEPKLTQNTSKPLQISKEELQKSDALRASQGLEPLEKVTNVQIVPSTKGPSKPEPTLSNDNTTTLYGKTFATFTPKDKDSGVASSFLKTPFVGTKSQTEQVPSTTLLDPLQFAIGGAGRIIKTGGEALLNVLKPEAKVAAKESAKVGTADIGLNLNKPTAKQTTAKRETDLLNNFNRNVQASQGKQVTKVQQAKADRILSQTKTTTAQPMTSQNVNLGTGIGKQLGKDGGTTLTDKFRPSPPTKPTPPNGKEVTVGKGGLTQIVKEKPQIQKPKPVQEQITQMKQEQINLGTGTVRQVQKSKVETLPKTQAQTKTENYLQSLQKPKPIFKPKQEQSHDQVFENLNKSKPAIAKPQPQKQRQGTAPVLIPTPPPGRNPPRTVPTLIPITTTTQKQRQEKVGITDMITTSVTRGKTPPPPPPKITTPPPPKMTGETPPPDKRPPPFVGLGINPANGLLGKVSKSGASKAYIGNVPLSSLVGIYKRSEVTYGNTGGIARSSARNESNKFNSLSRKSKSPKLI